MQRMLISRQSKQTISVFGMITSHSLARWLYTLFVNRVKLGFWIPMGTKHIQGPLGTGLVLSLQWHWRQQWYPPANIWSSQFYTCWIGHLDRPGFLSQWKKLCTHRRSFHQLRHYHHISVLKESGVCTNVCISWEILTQMLNTFHEKLKQKKTEIDVVMWRTKLKTGQMRNWEEAIPKFTIPKSAF